MKALLTVLLCCIAATIYGQNYLGWTMSEIQAEMKKNSDMEYFTELERANDGSWYIGYMSYSTMSETRAYYFNSNSPDSECVFVKWTTSKNSLSEWVNFLAMNCKQIDDLNWLEESKQIQYTLSEPRSGLLQIDIQYN